MRILLRVGGEEAEVKTFTTALEAKEAIDAGFEEGLTIGVQVVKNDEDEADVEATVFSGVAEAKEHIDTIVAEGDESAAGTASSDAGGADAGAGEGAAA